MSGDWAGAIPDNPTLPQNIVWTGSFLLEVGGGIQRFPGMPGPVTREEFDELADEVHGEKVVTRHILEQTRRNGDDIAAIKVRLTRVEDKVDIVDRKVDGLTRDLPKIVGEVMREVMKEERKKR